VTCTVAGSSPPLTRNIAHRTEPEEVLVGHCIVDDDVNRTGVDALPEATEAANHPADGAPAARVAACGRAADAASTPLRG
jgi:hypothetical protein